MRWSYLLLRSDLSSGTAGWDSEQTSGGSLWAELMPNLEYTVAKHQSYNLLQCCHFSTWHSAQMRKKEKKILVLYKTILFFNNEIPFSMKYIKLYMKANVFSMNQLICAFKWIQLINKYIKLCTPRNILLVIITVI